MNLPAAPGRLGPLLEDAKRWYAGLSRRDQQFLAVGAGALALILFIAVATSFNGKVRRYRRQASERREQLREMLGWQEEIKSLKAKVDALGQPGKDFSLQTTVATLANQEGIRIDSMRPGPVATSGPYKESSLEVRLTPVTLNRLVSYLYKIEKTPGVPLRVKRIHIKPTFKDPHLLEVIFLVSVLQTA